VDSDLELRVVTTETRPVIERLWQLYRHDLSEFRNSMPDDDGLFQERPLLPYFADDPDRIAYLVYFGTRPAGLVLVHGLSADHREIGEFFVVRHLRRRRVGHQLALKVLAHYPGRWQIAFQEENPGAARFWRQVATAAAGNGWTEELRQNPDKPQIPPDVWITLDVRAVGADG
jgi:predicted acetyltransferase